MEAKTQKDKPENAVPIESAKTRYNITFHVKEDEVIGELFWDNGVLEFRGNVEESAKIFFEVLKPFVDVYIKEERRKNET